MSDPWIKMCPVTLVDSWTSAMIQCVCGAVFQASGKPSDVNAKQKAWDQQHKNCVKQKRDGSKVFWLSFCDNTKPKGSQFLGACLIDVTAAEADDAAIDVLLKFPLAQPGAEWLAAATKKAHRLGCNPGGEVALMEVQPDNPHLSRYALGVLMDRATIARLDVVN